MAGTSSYEMVPPGMAVRVCTAQWLRFATGEVLNVDGGHTRV
ncbi:hypothetical protein [Pyxidicoccus sp. MSG2]|nr:hypothetical protein [Pyxidicoccus sp. MSG2]MCY1017906.1 hypothetical protein [Pyxidicoccus sp. MSG2]